MADGLMRCLIGSFTGRGISGALMDSSGNYFDRRSVRGARCSFFKLLPTLRVAFVAILDGSTPWRMKRSYDINLSN